MSRLIAVAPFPAPASLYVSDRLPAVEERVRYWTASASTISDRSIAADIDSANVWTNDYNVSSAH